jgi:sulfite exporter TauE/SafE/copper chaperone CopZ
METQIKKCEFFVEGMHCAACELLIEKKLSKVEGVRKVDAKLNQGKVYIETEKDLKSEELSILVEKDGYRIVDIGGTKNKTNWREIYLAGLIALAVIILFLIVQKLGIVNLVSSDKVTLPFVFMIGIVASLSTCMAVVGGLVLSISSNYAKEGSKVKPLIAFHLSRMIGFFILGGVIGLLGSAFILTSTTTFLLNLVLFIVMVIMGINLLDISHHAKKLQIKLPKFLGRNVFKLENNNSAFAPIALGIATFVLPCGFTQSMQLYSLTTGNFLEGAITMFVFALGTFPVLALISFASVKFSKTLQSGIFFKTAGFIVLFFAVFNFTAALVAVGIIEPIFNI